MTKDERIRQNRFAAKEWASKLAESDKWLKDDKAPEKPIETTAESSFTSSLASGASFLGREVAKRETKSREVSRHIKIERSIVLKVYGSGKEALRNLQEAVCCRFFQGSVDLLKNVSNKSGPGSTWLVRCDNCPLPITNDAFSTTERTEQSRAFEINCCRVSFLTFSCCVTIVVPSLVCINIDSFGVIIYYNLITGNTPPKIFFHYFFQTKIRAS